jgi:hypothetical protein
MENSVEIIGELRQISPFLAENRPGMPYAVPAGYFDAFPPQILGTVVEQVPVLNGIPASSFQAPEGYFESLAGNLLQKIRRQEADGGLMEDTPLLNSISKQNVFSVPAGYFEKAVVVPEKQKAKLVTLARKWTQYAAAAVIAGILVTTAFLVTDTTREPEYKKYERLDLPTELDKMSENELVNYLVTPELPANVTASNNDVITAVKDNIQSLSDEELNQYLKENTDTDLLIPASNN